jgi:hypothetical protein
MNKIATTLLTALCLSSAMAQDEVLEEEPIEVIRRYTVEVIVFAYVEDVSIGTEIFLPDPPPPEEELLFDEDGNIIELDEDLVPVEIEDDVEDSDESDDEEAESDEPGLVLLSEEELTLSDQIRQFELLDAYETIMHFGWTQPTYPEEETLPVDLTELAEPPAGLAGTFTLYLSRYLHLVIDLALDAPADFDVPIVVDEPGFRFGDYRNSFDDDVEDELDPIRFRIQENRIVKNGELRYFDHPKFGVLAKITRVEEEEEDLETEGLPEPLLSSRQ